MFNELLSVDPTGNLAELDGALIQSLEMIGSDLGEQTILMMIVLNNLMIRCFHELLAGYLSDEESLHH
nr:hypothetical protein [Vibrio vulnificus]